MAMFRFFGHSSSSTGSTPPTPESDEIPPYILIPSIIGGVLFLVALCVLVRKCFKEKCSNKEDTSQNAFLLIPEDVKNKVFLPQLSTEDIDKLSDPEREALGMQCRNP